MARIASDCVTETPIDAAGEVLDILLDSLVRPTVLQRVVDGELILAAGFASGHGNCFVNSKFVDTTSASSPALRIAKNLNFAFQTYHTGASQNGRKYVMIRVENQGISSL